MLYQADNPSFALERCAGDPVRAFCIRNAAKTGEGHPPVVLVDDQADPQIVIVHSGSNFMFLGEMEAYNPALKDILEGNVEQDGGWPGESIRQDWEKYTGGRRYIFINSAPVAAWRAALLAGFESDPDAKDNLAYLWHIGGQPRFADLVKHPCRLGEGTELLELMKQGVPYDEEGEYITMCLEHGPSFVCEVDGEPVCWACTHLNGTMGMIYTPEEHRRLGYAKSLAAFQIDHMLKNHGMAGCHIIDFNTPSMRLVRNFGAECCIEPCVWRVVFWPGEGPRHDATAAEKD